jgi:hypothetical protein
VADEGMVAAVETACSVETEMVGVGTVTVAEMA